MGPGEDRAYATPVTSLQTLVTSTVPRAAPDSRWPVSVFPGPPNRGLAIVQQLHLQQRPATELNQPVAVLPTGDAHLTSAQPSASASRPAEANPPQGSAAAIRQVVVLEVEGRLGEVVKDLDRAIQLALAEGPRGVVCDLSALVDGSDPGGVEMLATVGRHVRDWPGTPVAVACADQHLRKELNAHPLGRHLIVTESTTCAVSLVLATPVQVVERLRLAANPSAPCASRNFVARILRDWQLERVIPFASVVVSRLVARSSLNAGTAIDLSVAWDAGALRLTVRDHGPALPGQRRSDPTLQGRGLTVAVAGLSRAFGALPTADGGNVVWAVFEAPRSIVQPALEGPTPAASI